MENKKMKYPMKKELVDGLITKFNYPKSGAMIVASKLLHLQVFLKPLFIDWWFNEIKPSIKLEGYTFERLTDSYKMNPIAAFLTLDWLSRDPKQARISLEHGYDFINTGTVINKKK
jgi:hypothetical protein